MQTTIKHLSLYLLCFSAGAFSLTVTPEQSVEIGNKIWKNECGGTLEGLTHWGEGENFPSLGIGHFIWLSKNQEECFQETFPDLLKFIESQGTLIPEWLKKTEGCPWSSKEEFQKNKDGKEIQSLRQFLVETRNLQAIFMANRLEQSFSNMLNSCSEEDKLRVSPNFYSLVKEPGGLYALMDYLNFKGEGTSSKEAYQGEGWGLLQVLKNMPPDSKKPLFEFVQSAKAILQRRVENSPPEREEKRWLKGWMNRLETYLE
jgi:hypothetical protein